MDVGFVVECDREARRRAPSKCTTGEALLTARRAAFAGLLAAVPPSVAFGVVRSGSGGRTDSADRRVLRRRPGRETALHRSGCHHGDPGAKAPKHDSPAGLPRAVVRAGCLRGTSVAPKAAVPPLDLLALVRRPAGGLAARGPLGTLVPEPS